MKKEIYNFLLKNVNKENDVFEVYKIMPGRYRMYHKEGLCIEALRLKNKFTGEYYYIIDTNMFQGFNDIDLFSLHKLLINQ